MESSNTYKIFLLGEKGQLSQSIQSYFLQKNINFKVVKISKKNNLVNSIQLTCFLRDSINTKDKFLIINTIASLYPKNKSDIYINRKMPLDLLVFVKKYDSFLIHLSTNNVLVPELLDEYSTQKKYAERLILKNEYKKSLIIRLPLLIPFQTLKKKKYPKQFKFLMNLLNLPFISLIPPSRNIYRPLNIDIAAEMISELILSGEFVSMKKTISLNGSEKMNLSQICSLLIFSNKKKFTIDFSKPFFWYILDKTFRIFPSFRKFCMKNTLLQQFLPIER